MTPAIDHLKRSSIPFKEHRFQYKEHGGTAHSSQALGVSEHSVIKTLIFESDTGEPICVLMHGDCMVDGKALCRALSTSNDGPFAVRCKRAHPCAPDRATRFSGYLIGGTSPFGLKTRMPIVAESTILSLPTLFINGGARGFLVELSPESLTSALQSQWGAPLWASIAKRG